MADFRTPHADFTMSLPLNIASRREFLCQPCERKCRRNEPVGYCKDCMKYLCEACHSSHLGTKLTKHHVLFDWKSPTRSFRMPKIKLSKGTDDACTTRCEEHDDRVVEYFCTGHELLGCSVCMAKDHANCDSVKYIPDISAGVDDGEDYRNYLKDLIFLMQRSQATIRQLKEVKNKAEHHSANVIHHIRKHRTQLNEALDELENELMLQVDTAKTRDLNKIDDCMRKYENTCHEVERIMSGLQGMQQAKQRCRLFVAIKNKETSLQPLTNILNNREEILCMLYKFNPNVEALGQLQDMCALGNIGETGSVEVSQPSNLVREKVQEFENKSKVQVSLTPMSQNSPACGDSAHVMTTSLDDPDYVDNYFDAHDKQVVVVTDGVTSGCIGEDHDALAETPREITLTQVGNIRVKLSKDCYPVSVTGSVLLHDNNLVIVDSANWSVKLVDTQKNELIQDIKENGCPWDVTNVYDNEVAVTLPILKRIELFKYGPIFSSRGEQLKHVGLRKVRDIQVRGFCYGIAHRGDKLIVSYAPDLFFKDGPAKIEILTTHGHVLQRLCAGDAGDRLFIEPRYVTFGNDDRTVYVSDWGDNSVTSLSTDGDILAMYEDVDLQTPGKLLKDSNDTIFVCGRQSLIHRISADCEKLDVAVLHGGMEAGPKTITIAEDQGLLYTGSTEDDFIKVYQIE